MKRDQAGLLRNGVEQRGQIGVSEYDFRIGRECVIGDRIEDAHRAVAAAQGKDAAYRRIPRCVVEVGRALRVAACEIAVALSGEAAQTRYQAERAHDVLRARKLIVGGERSGRRDQRDDLAAAKRGRKQRRFQRRSSVRSG